MRFTFLMLHHNEAVQHDVAVISTVGGQQCVRGFAACCTKNHSSVTQPSLALFTFLMYL